jgi:hypothetical protein
MQQGCPQPHEEVPSALETLLLESASYLSLSLYIISADNIYIVDLEAGGEVTSQAFVPWMSGKESKLKKSRKYNKH